MRRRAARRRRDAGELPLDLLQRGKYQPRIDMRQETLQELADSIKAQGVVQPIVVRPLARPAQRRSHSATRSSPASAAGARRSSPGCTTIPAVVRDVPDEAAIAMALIENIQRENLNPLEEARALERLITEFGITHQQAADAVGRSRAAVSQPAAPAGAARPVREMVERRELEMGHARALLGLERRSMRVEFASGS